MVSVAKIRKLTEVVEKLAPYMTDEEISDIGTILLRVTNRLIKENKEANI